MTMRSQIRGNKFLTVVSVYDPLTNYDNVKNKFYEDSRVYPKTVLEAGKLIVVGDSSARVCKDHVLTGP
ncbi:hypothetical protein SprV_0100225400 [Sparganum proliferum]